MQQVEQVAVSPEVPLRELLEKMERNVPSASGIPSGIGLALDRKGAVAGLVTDGDIRRALVRGETLESPVSAVMNARPLLIEGVASPRAILARVFEASREGRWDRSHFEKIVVVDEKRRPLQITTIHEVWEASDVRFKRVGIVGLGYVGLTLGLTLADLGFAVHGFDVNKTLAKDIARGKPPFFERGLNQMLADHGGKNFKVVDAFTGAHACDVYCIAVGTPIDKKGEADLTALRAAAAGIGAVLKRGDLVLLRSTVPLGTTRETVIPALQEASGLSAGTDFLVAFAPERTVEGKALEELRTLPQVIGGFNTASAELASNLFSTLTKSIVLVNSLEEAEMVKLVNNTYRDVSFAFANEVSLVSRRWGVDTRRVIDAANFGYERSRVPHPSPGVGGYCLTKDPLIFISSAKRKGYSPALPHHARKLSAAMVSSVADAVGKFARAQGKSLASARVLILGFAFKGRPETSDVRGSPTRDLIEALRARGIRRIWGYDPLVRKEDIAGMGAAHLPKPHEGFRRADAVVVMHNGPHLETLPIRSLFSKRRAPVLLVDSWGLYSPDDMQKLSHVTHYRL